MIDIHCHILPGIDDGSRSLQESLEMAKIAVSEGIDTMISTAHYHTELDYVKGEELKEAARSFNKELERQGIDLKVLVGNELYYSSELMARIDELDFFTLAGSRYVLIEFRPDQLPSDMGGIAYEFGIRDRIPIIAHIERYSQVAERPDMVKEFIEDGYLIQVNARSLRKSEDRVAKTARELFERRMVHFVATDSHRSDVRTPRIRDAYIEAIDLLGEETADVIFKENPRRLISNESIEPFEITDIQENGRKSVIDIIRRLVKKR